jgi:hypothetical protein
MQPTSTSNIGLQVTVKLGLAPSLTTVQMEESQVMMFGSLTAQDDKLMYKALTTIKLLIFPLLQLALSWYKQEVDDKSIKVGGKQRIKTLDGYVIPLDVKSGLPYVKMRPYTDEEWDSLPHVILTGDGDWNPSVLDHSLTDDEHWYDAVSDFPDAMDGNPFDAEGNYRNLHVFDLFSTDSILDNHIIPDLPWLYQAHEHQIIENEQDFAQLRPNFAWLPENVVKDTTQYARMPMSTVLKKHYKSPFPALNVHRREEALATNTVYSNVPAVDSGVTIAQLFVGLTFTVCDVYPLKAKKAFVNTLQDVIRLRGAPSKLVSDRAQVEISGRVKEYPQVPHHWRLAK